MIWLRPAASRLPPIPLILLILLLPVAARRPPRLDRKAPLDVVFSTVFSNYLCYYSTSSTATTAQSFLRLQSRHIS